MISLRALLLGEDIKYAQGDNTGTMRDRSVTRVDSEDSSVVSYRAKNTVGDVRYFDDEDTARKFARGEIKGRHPGHPEPKQRVKPIEKKQTYKTKNN